MAAGLLRPLSGLADPPPAAGETLYNGITLASPWPPRLKYPNEHPVRPPYLAQPPAVIPIDVGRQLFVDDFLIEETTMAQTWHRAEYHPASPVLRPEKKWELRDEYAERTKTRPNPAAMVFSDGVFFDPAEKRFKMWYMGGYQTNTCYAVSEDGLTWHKPELDVVRGTNIVFDEHRDSSTVWLDLFEADRRRRYKMAIWDDHKLSLHVSPDGLHWERMGETGRAGDRTTFFYNPFRNMWVFGVRADQFTHQVSGRYRKYWESRDFLAARAWDSTEPVAWVKADSRERATAGAVPELYNLDCVGVRERPARTVHHLARRIGDARENQRAGGRLQPRRLPLASTGATRELRRRLGRAGELELGQRAVGRRLLRDRRRPSVLLRERPSGRAGDESAGRVLHRSGDAAARRLCLDGLAAG